MRVPLSFFLSLTVTLASAVPAGAAHPCVKGGQCCNVNHTDCFIDFFDVPPDAWFTTYVHEASKTGIVSGYKDAHENLTGYFGPGNRVTIAEALKIAVEGAGYDVEKYKQGMTCYQGDCPWYQPYLILAKYNEFQILHQTKNFDRPATRGEVAQIFTDAFRVQMTANDPNPYVDVQSETPYGSSIRALGRDGIVSGDTNASGQATGTFRPSADINRAETVKIVINARAKYGEPGIALDRPSDQKGDVSVIYTDEGFSPETITITPVTRVIFRNESSQDLWVASDPHPAHSDHPLFDMRGSITPWMTFPFTFNQEEQGTWNYHNHVHPEHRGTIIIRSP